MKRAAYELTLTLGLLLVLSGIPFAQSGTIVPRPGEETAAVREPLPSGHGGRMGSGMMGMMGSPMMREMISGTTGGAMDDWSEMMGMHRPSQLLHMLQAELGLSDDQVKQLRPIVVGAIKTEINDRASLRGAQIDLGELLQAEPVDMAKVESHLKTIEGLRTALQLNLIKAHEQGKALLTPEQRQKLANLHERLPGMMASIGRGMTSQGGMQGMGMMGSGMQARMRSGRGPMMQMQSMLQQIGGMLEQMAARMQAGQLTPEQVQQMGGTLGQMGEMMGGMGPDMGGQQRMGQMSQMMQHIAEMQKHMSEMMGQLQPEKR